MQNKLKCLFIVVIGGLIILFNFTGCFSKSNTVVPSQGMSPVETVQFYFEQWDNKNTEAMNCVLCDEIKNTDYGKSHLIYVQLTKSIEETEKHMNLEGEYFKNTFPGYVAYSVVEVEYEIEYKKSRFFNNTGGFPDGKSIIDNWRFVLGKTDEKSDWIIVSWGV